MKTLHISIIIVTVLCVLTSIILVPVFGEEWQSFITTIEPSANPNQPVHDFTISYQILNGTGTFQAHDYEFTANISSKSSGTFAIKIPRNFPYYNGKDGPSENEKYVILENGADLTPSRYYKTVSDCFFTYSIPFYMNSTITVESSDTLYLMTPIYGDKIPDYCMSKTMIPEFPFAIPVLLIGVTSLIVFSRIKMGK
ncbi:MAG: hypothetical protein LV477_04225 [Candidatus Nitrosotalea sp.]|nr:hypothetical protein [Candidatus Nitrosotalea sp.]